MAEFKPAFPYSTPIELLIPSYTKKKGVPVKSFPDIGIRLNCSFKTYGGTETTANDLYTVIDTAIVETWYRPDIKPDCRIKLLPSGEVYDIIGKPENVNKRNQFLKFKVRAVEGGA
jgi:head-tail adaptor